MSTQELGGYLRMWPSFLASSPMILKFEHILKSVSTVTSSSALTSLTLEIGFVNKSIQTNFMCLHFSPF